MDLAIRDVKPGPVEIVTENPLLSADAKQAIVSANARKLLKL